MLLPYKNCPNVMQSENAANFEFKPNSGRFGDGSEDLGILSSFNQCHGSVLRVYEGVLNGLMQRDLLINQIEELRNFSLGECRPPAAPKNSTDSYIPTEWTTPLFDGVLGAIQSDERHSLLTCWRAIYAIPALKQHMADKVLVDDKINASISSFLKMSVGDEYKSTALPKAIQRHESTVDQVRINMGFPAPEPVKSRMFISRNSPLRAMM